MLSNRVITSDKNKHRSQFKTSRCIS